MLFKPVVWKNPLYVAATQKKLITQYTVYKIIAQDIGRINPNPCLQGLSVHVTLSLLIGNFIMVSVVVGSKSEMSIVNGSLCFCRPQKEACTFALL